MMNRRISGFNFTGIRIPDSQSNVASPEPAIKRNCTGYVYLENIYII